MNMSAETKQQSGIAQARHLPFVTNTHLQERALIAKGSNRVERGRSLQCEALAEAKR